MLYVWPQTHGIYQWPIIIGGWRVLPKTLPPFLIYLSVINNKVHLLSVAIFNFFMETNYNLSTTHPQKDENIYILTHLQKFWGHLEF